MLNEQSPINQNIVSLDFVSKRDGSWGWVWEEREGYITDKMIETVEFFFKHFKYFRTTMYEQPELFIMNQT